MVCTRTPCKQEQRRTDGNEPAPDHHPYESVLRVRMSALSRRTPEVVLLEPGRDEERKGNTDEH